jgi:hypothetical protein
MKKFPVVAVALPAASSDSTGKRAALRKKV